MKRISRPNQVFHGMGNGVFKVVNNAAVRVHVHRHRVDVVERTISTAEIPHQVGRLERLRSHFLPTGDHADPLSMISADLIVQAITMVREERINAEAALNRLTSQYDGMLSDGLRRMEGKITAARARVSQVASNGVVTDGKSDLPEDPDREVISTRDHLDDLDQAVISARNHYERQKVFRQDFVGVADTLTASLHDLNGETAPADVIHVADELSWLEMTRLYAAGAKAFVLNSAFLGPVNHPFIFSHKDGIPLVVMKDPLSMIGLDSRISIDSRTGQVILNPSEDTVAALKFRRQNYSHLARLFKERSDTLISLDGKPLPALQANIKDRHDIAHLKTVAVGLFRTEGLYDEGRCLVQTLVRAFKSVIRKTVSVNIRLFDLAMDKLPSFLAAEFKGEERGVSFLLWTKLGRSLLIDQVKALLIAAERLAKGKSDELTGKNVRLIVPMVSDPVEIREIRKVIAEVEQDLLAKRLISEPISDRIELGAMIETREAVANIEQLAAEVTYFSLGSNDLTMALLGFTKRTKLMTGPEYDWLSPTVLHGIKQVVATAKRRGLGIGSCGEVSRDPLAAIVLTLMGIDSLSMDESYRTEINYVLTNIHLGEWRKFSVYDPEDLSVIDRLLTFNDALEVRQHLFDLIRRTHADTQVALENEITAARPLTYQEPQAI